MVYLVAMFHGIVEARARSLASRRVRRSRCLVDRPTRAISGFIEGTGWDWLEGGREGGMDLARAAGRGRRWCGVGRGRGKAILSGRDIGKKNFSILTK